MPPESAASVGLFGTLVTVTFGGAAWLGYRRWNVALVLLVGSAPFLGLGTGAVLVERPTLDGPAAIGGAVVGGSVLVGVWGYGLGVAARWLLTDGDPTVNDVGRLGVLLLGGSAVVAVSSYVYWATAPQSFPW